MNRRPVGTKLDDLRRERESGMRRFVIVLTMIVFIVICATFGAGAYLVTHPHRLGEFIGQISAGIRESSK
jgi:uncharacterized membrane protein